MQNERKIKEKDSTKTLLIATKGQVFWYNLRASGIEKRERGKTFEPRNNT